MHKKKYRYPRQTVVKIIHTASFVFKEYLGAEQSQSTRSGFTEDSMIQSWILLQAKVSWMYLECNLLTKLMQIAVIGKDVFGQ